MIVPPTSAVVTRERFSLDQRILAALELAAEETKGSPALLASLAHDLLHCPIDQITAVRDRIAAAYPLPEGVTR